MIQLSAIILDPVAAPGMRNSRAGRAAAQAITGSFALPQHRRGAQMLYSQGHPIGYGHDAEEFLSGDGGPAAPSAVGSMIALARDHLTGLRARRAGLAESLRPLLPLRLDEGASRQRWLGVKRRCSRNHRHWPMAQELADVPPRTSGWS